MYRQQGTSQRAPKSLSVVWRNKTNEAIHKQKMGKEKEKGKDRETNAKVENRTKREWYNGHRNET